MTLSLPRPAALTYYGALTHFLSFASFLYVSVSGSLPVYWGTSSVDRYMPGPHAVIKARDFEGPKELAAYLKQV